MKTIYTVIIHLVFGGISSVKPFEDKGEMEVYVLDWVNKNCPEGVSFTNPYEGETWFSENSDKVEEGIKVYEFTPSPPPSVVDPLKSRLRQMAETVAVGFYITDDDRPSYGEVMDAEDIYDIATVWEPLAHYEDDEIKSLIEKEADSVEGFAHAVIEAMSIDDLLGEIARRAEYEGIVDSREKVCLLAVRGMDETEKDILEEEDGLWAIGFNEVIIKTENCTSNERVKKMGEFGITYVHGV